jgi:hypothetical protein
VAEDAREDRGGHNPQRVVVVAAKVPEGDEHSSHRQVVAAAAVATDRTDRLATVSHGRHTRGTQEEAGVADISNRHKQQPAAEDRLAGDVQGNHNRTLPEEAGEVRSPGAHSVEHHSNRALRREARQSVVRQGNMAREERHHRDRVVEANGGCLWG